MDIKARGVTKNIMALRGVAVGVFVIPILFSLVYGGTVLTLALDDGERLHIAIPAPKSTDAMRFVDIKSEYAISERVTATVSVDNPAFDCGDLYVTIFDVSGSQKRAVTQGAFFEQCYGQSGVLPLDESFSEQLEMGTYQIEAQLFDKEGNDFLTTMQQFRVR